MEQEKKQDQELAADELIANTQSVESERNSDSPQREDAAEKEQNRIFKKYKIKDIVFLAVITACTLVLGVPMPFVKDVPLFGIIQLVLGLQFSILPVIGMMKVRKPGALLLQSAFISVFLILMFPPMAFIMLCALAAELVALLVFRGYQNDWACVLAGTIYLPLTLPFMYLYAVTLYSGDSKTYTSIEIMLGVNNAPLVIGMTVAVVALCFVGSVVGMLIARELRKAGKL